MNIREKFLNHLVSIALYRRRMVLLTTIIFTMLMMGAAELIKIDFRWTALMPETIPEVNEFIHVDENFYQPGNTVVVISGQDTNTLEKITDEAVAILKNKMLCPEKIDVEQCKKTKKYIRYIYGKLPEKWLSENMLHLSKPKDSKRLYKILKDTRLVPYLTALNNDYEAEYSDSENVANQESEIVSSFNSLESFLRTIKSSLEGVYNPENISKIVRNQTVGQIYSLSLDNKMSLISISVAVTTNDVETIPLIDREIEKNLIPLQKKYKNYKIERTGMVPINRDEMDSIGPYTIAITMFALVFIFFLLVWNFKSWLIPFFSLLPIIIGIIWAMGIIGLTLGSMNMITMMIMVVLLGLGIDFTIHLSSRFHEEIAYGKSIEEALRATIVSTGKGVFTGALTTAIAFFALMIADINAISEFGFCAGIGIIVTLLAVFWTLPSLLSYHSLRTQKIPGKKYSVSEFKALGLLIDKIHSKKILVIVVSVLLLLVSLYSYTKLKWEYNFMNLEPENLRSIDLQDEIVEKYKFSVTPSFLTVNSINQSRKIRKKLKKKRMVGLVDELSQWISRKDYKKSLKYIKKLKVANVKNKNFLSLEDAKNQKEFAKQMERLKFNIIEIQAMSFMGGQDRVVEKTKQLVGKKGNRKKSLLFKLDKMLKSNTNIKWNIIDKFSKEFSKELKKRVSLMTSKERPVSLDMVPESIKAKYVSFNKTGKTKYLMTILPKKNLFQKKELEAFNKSVLKINKRITGMPQLTLIMNATTKEEGSKAVLLALLAIFILLLIDFKRPLLAVLTFLPLLLGFSMTLGVLWLLGEKLNYVNMIAFPVIVGIGVDDGVHFFHRYLDEGRGNMKIAIVSVGRAMLMTSLTTMIGFGSLMFYLMRGMASMGLVLFLGVGFCFLVTITLLPALALIFDKQIFKNEIKG